MSRIVVSIKQTTFLLCFSLMVEGIYSEGAFAAIMINSVTLNEASSVNVAAGNNVTATTSGASPTNTLPNPVKTVPPSVSFINTAATNPNTVGAQVSWTVIFNRSVSGVDATDFSLIQSGVTGASIASVTGSGSTWTVTANAGSGAGSLGLNLVDNDSIIDASSLKLGGTGTGNGNFTGQVYTLQLQLIASFRMEEASWNGTANELVDTAGFSGGPFNGQAIGTPKPSPASVSPARTGNPGTCGYASMPGPYSNGGAFSIPNLPVSTVSGQKTSVSFWMYWNGTNGVMPIGWNVHDLWFVSGWFGFNTGNSDIYGIASAGLVNGWHHVVAVFTNGSVTRNEIYIDSVKQTLSQRLSSPNIGTAVVSTTLRIGGWMADTGYRFSGRIDEVKVYKGALSQTEVTALYNETHVCGGGVSPGLVNPVGFNCIEAGQSALSGRLHSKLTGVPFLFDVAALKDANNDGVADGVLTTFASDVNRNVTVELVDGSSGGTCSALPAIVSQTLTFNKTAQTTEQGRKSSASMTVSSAYPNLRCRVTDTTQSPSVDPKCSTDNFAVRPTGFILASSNANADGSGSSVTATPVIKTGAAFNLNATAIAGYNGTPTLDATKVVAHSISVPGNSIVPVPGTLSGAFFVANPVIGIASGNGFNYSEVGYFALSAYGVYDASFTAVDSSNGDCSNDFSNNLVAGQYGCKFGNTAQSSYFGRFIPDRFDVALNIPIFAPACTTFSYVGQPIKYATKPVATVTAKNAFGATTQNYTGSLWKINPGDATYGITPSYSEASQTLALLSTNVSAVADSLNGGTGTISFANTTDNILSVMRDNPLAQFNAEIALSFNLLDTDAVAVANVNGVPGANPVHFGAASAGNGIAFTGGNKAMRWGRLVMQNAHGSELTPLELPLYSEYFNGSSFVNNSADQCTSLTLSNQLSLSNPGTAGGAAQPGNAVMTLGAGSTQATLVNAPLSAGLAGLSFSAPGSGNTGYIDITSNFASFPWLLFDWDHDGNHNNSPSARATFGIYKGNSKQIYLREVY